MLDELLRKLNNVLEKKEITIRTETDTGVTNFTFIPVEVTYDDTGLKIYDAEGNGIWFTHLEKLKLFREINNNSIQPYSLIDINTGNTYDIWV